MLSIAVCDDEILACCQIAGKIKRVLAELKLPGIVRQFTSGQALIESPDSFDILFLDILMQDFDGMETARRLRDRAFDKILIFVSSSRDYVFEAYDVEAFQYLVKPVEEGKLKGVLERAIRKTQHRSQDFLIVSRERQQMKLFLDDIYYFEIRGRIMDIHGTDGIFTYYEQIGLLEKRLQGKGFFRCHKSYLINFRHVDGYNRQAAFLDNGEEIGIAKRRYEEFSRELLAYMREQGGIL